VRCYSVADKACRVSIHLEDIKVALLCNWHNDLVALQIPLDALDGVPYVCQWAKQKQHITCLDYLHNHMCISCAKLHI